jgi:predicted nuclease of restriction endonuclease-like RecB superfamily
MADRGQDAVVEISGPLTLFRRTLVYGRALASLVPGLVWCDRFRLDARCALYDQLISVEIRSGDPIFPGPESRRFDSKLEERFARDFRRAAPDWDVIREPEPITTARSVIFPDFALQHRRDLDRRWLLEIVGFWTQDYLERKLACLREARIDNLILCLDATRDCGGLALPTGARLVYFRRRVDAAEILRIVQPEGLT